MIHQKLFRKHQLDELKKEISKVETTKILVLRGASSYKNCGAEAFVNNLLDKKPITSFSDFSPNPNVTDLLNGIDVFHSGDFKMIIAIGGGSVLDMGKLISVFAHQTNHPQDIIKGRTSLLEMKTTLLAIPTTAGSGAEATQFAVVYMGKNKYSVESPIMLPDMVFLNPVFTEQTPAYLTACSGIDAFCQAVESVWSVNANKESEEIALLAIKKIIQFLKDAVHHDDSLARAEMQEAAFLAGKAINITKTTAPHALSYSFTSFYGLPHGHAVALSLPFFFEFNSSLTKNDCVDSRGVDAVKKRIEKIADIFGTTMDHARTFLENFISDIGLEMNIQQLIPDFNPDFIIKNVNLERLKNNPRLVLEQDIVEFLKS